MRIRRPRTAFRDGRGAIIDVLDGIRVEAVALLTSRRGAVRGNHYHQKTTQYVYVLKGKLRVYAQRPGGAVRRRTVRGGDLVVTEPRERHAFVALEPSVLLACAHGPRRGRSYEDDTYRLAVPLV